MTEQEAIKSLKIARDDLYRLATHGHENFETEAISLAIANLEEIQQYREIERDLERYHANVDIPRLIHCFIDTVFEGEKHEGFCLLTNEDADAWEAYKEIGTVEECREAVEKQTPKKPNFEGDGCDEEGNIIYDTWICPNCGKNYEVDYDEYDYCPNCGQAIDWSEKNEID